MIYQCFDKLYIGGIKTFSIRFTTRRQFVIFYSVGYTGYTGYTCFTGYTGSTVCTGYTGYTGYTCYWGYKGYTGQTLNTLSWKPNKSASMEIMRSCCYGSRLKLAKQHPTYFNSTLKHIMEKTISKQHFIC